MMQGKYLTAGQLAPTKPPRVLAKDQEVALLNEQVEDLETSISVNMQLMHDIASARPVPSGDDTEVCLHLLSRVSERLQEQRKRLEAALTHTTAQRNLCLLKIARSEQETKQAAAAEERGFNELTRRIDAARKVVEEKETTIQALEDTLARLESECRACKESKVSVVDMPGTQLRITRLTRAVRQDEQLTQAEKQEAFEKCRVSFTQTFEQQLQQDRRSFPKELHTRSAAGVLTDDFGLHLTYENYLQPEKPQDVSVVSVAESGHSQALSEAKVEYGHVKSKSEWPGQSSGPAEQTKVDSATGKLEEVTLAVRMKHEEMTSLRKLSSYLDSQKVLLTHKLHLLRSRAAGETQPPDPPFEVPSLPEVPSSLEP